MQEQENKRLEQTAPLSVAELQQQIDEIEGRLHKRRPRKERKRRSLPHLLVCYLAVISLLLTPITLSKYLATANGSSDSRIAGIGSNIYYVEEQVSVEITSDQNFVFGFVQEFVVSNEGDVTFDYVIDMKLSQQSDSASYDSPVTPTYTTFSLATVPSTLYGVSNNAAAATSIATLTDNQISNITAGSMYIATSTTGLANSYTWQTLSVGNEATTFNTSNLTNWSSSLSFPATADDYSLHYFKVITFVDLRSQTISDTFTIENTQILYSMTCTQKD